MIKTNIRSITTKGDLVKAGKNQAFYLTGKAIELREGSKVILRCTRKTVLGIFTKDTYIDPVLFYNKRNKWRI